MTAIGGATSNCSCSREFVVASSLLITGIALAVIGGNRLPPLHFKMPSVAAIRANWKALSLVSSSVVVGMAALALYGYESSLYAHNTKPDAWTTFNPAFTDYLLDELKRAK